MKEVTAEEFDRIFDEGKEDMTEYLDLSTIYRGNNPVKRVNVDFPLWMIDALDREASRVGVARQAIIKMWIDERLSQERLAQLNQPAAA